MIIIALTAFTLTACNKKQSSGTTMEALPIDVARPMVQNVTLTKDYPGYLEAESTVDWWEGSMEYCRQRTLLRVRG